MPEPKPHLAYTVAIDPPGQTGCRLMAQMLAASLSRTPADLHFLCPQPDVDSMPTAEVSLYALSQS